MQNKNSEVLLTVNCDLINGQWEQKLDLPSPKTAISVWPLSKALHPPLFEESSSTVNSQRRKIYNWECESWHQLKRHALTMFPEDKMIVIHFQEGPNPQPLKMSLQTQTGKLVEKYMFTDYRGFLAAIFIIWSTETNVNVKVNALNYAKHVPFHSEIQTLVLWSVLPLINRNAKPQVWLLIIFFSYKKGCSPVSTAEFCSGLIFKNPESPLMLLSAN